MATLCAAIRRTVNVHGESYLYLLLPLLILQFQFDHGRSQQVFLNDYQSDCINNHTNILGYSCSDPLSSCTAYLTFMANVTYGYNTVTSISFLLSANDTAVAEANNVTDIATFPEGNLVYVPVNCSCTTVKSGNKYYQHNTTYRIKRKLETYATITSSVFEMLTSCQAMMDQNSYDPHNLLVGDVLAAPLMCVCPSANQIKKGFNYIVSYLVRSGESIQSIATLFGVDQQRILDANEIEVTSTIYGSYPILVPLETPPTKINLNPSQAPPPPSVNPPPSSGSSMNKWVFVGIGIGVVFVALLVLFLISFLFWRRKRRQQQQAAPLPADITRDESAGHKTLPGGVKGDLTSNSWSVSSDGIRYAIESLTVYKFDALQKATGDFSESNSINGSSVFRGEFNGDPAAVKVLNGDVSTEINILKQINHSNIIRLSGFCVYDGNTYLVYEFAEKGSLRDLLVKTKDPSLDWKQRVQIAYGIAEGLNYLHNYCSPPYVHKNLSSSNVLLDSNLRAKITNFGLARTVPEEDDEDGSGLMHLTKHVVGTKGYLAPEYIENGLVTPKMDVYAFGILVLELLSGRNVAVKASENKDEEMLTAASITEVLQGDNVREKLKRFMDGGFANRYPFDLAYSMAQLAKMCVAPDLNSRLSISEVLVLLSKIHSSSLDWDPSDELDRSSSLTQGR